MINSVSKKETGDLLSTPIFQQTAFWSVVKKKLGQPVMAVDFKIIDTTKGSGRNSDLLAIIKHPDPEFSVAYVPYGPEFEPEEECQGPFLEELSECLRPYLPVNCTMIRYELCWESYWAKESNNFDDYGHWNGEPEVQAQEMRFNFNTVKWNFRRAFGNLLPSSTLFINLKDDQDVIKKKMKPKTRYNIELAARKGVIVREAGIESMDVCYNLFRETALRNNICLYDRKYFETVLMTKADNTRSPVDVLMLIAEWEGTPLAALFLLISGKRGSYLYGASSSSHRNLMPSYAVQWEAIKICKQRGCSEYDMFGISPRPDTMHPLYGLYRFKTGFGGDLYHSLGTWDYPLDEKKYKIFRAYELNHTGTY